MPFLPAKDNPRKSAKIKTAINTITGTEATSVYCLYDTAQANKKMDITSNTTNIRR